MLEKGARAASAGAPGTDSETLPSDDRSLAGDRIRALVVSGPHGTARAILPEGLVSIGRDEASRVVIADPRVSRSHALLQVGERITLSDLGSVNGTFVADQRIEQGEARPLELGQAFSIGDSTLVVCATPLSRHQPRRLPSFEALAEHVVALPAPARPTPGLSVLKVRVPASAATLPLEAVLGPLLRTDGDFMLRFGQRTLLLGIAGVPTSSTAVAEHAVLRELVGFSIVADIEARFIPWERLEAAGEGLRALLAFEAPLTLSRGRVVVIDPVMKELERKIARVAPTPVNVLILGETGTGKDVVASMLHEFSGRSETPFIGINCASLPGELLESELFGHERGAFTGAVTARAGLLEAADGGTLFLDEIGDLPASLQAKLLRVLETRELTRLGSSKPRKIDVRFVAATNSDLASEVQAGRFRRDLYYRLNTITLELPALRDRPSEIVPLARLFHANACERFQIPVVPFGAAAIEALEDYAWPGNVRELRNAIERAVLVAEGEVEPYHLGIPACGSDLPSLSPEEDASDPASDDDSERERITRALETCGGNQSRAAKLLGMARRTLVRRIVQLGLPRPRD
jgi:transcriptional regulator with AAA-type ATPase domain